MFKLFTKYDFIELKPEKGKIKVGWFSPRQKSP